MPAVLRPEACPRCRRPFVLGYAVRRNATMPPTGRLLLLAGPAASLALLLLTFLLAGQAAWSLTEGTSLSYQDKGILFFLAYALLCLPLSLLPTIFGCRLAFRLPRRLPVACPDCGWSGVCRVKEAPSIRDPSTPPPPAPAPP